MNIYVNVTKEDYSEYVKYACARLVSPRSASHKKFFINVAIGFVGAFALFFALRYFRINFGQFHWPSAIVVAAPLLLFALLFSKNMKKIQQGSTPRDDGLVIGKRLLEFAEDGVRDSCNLGHFFYKWHAVQEVASVNGNVYLIIDGILAQIIPKNSFSSELERKEFLDRIHAMRTQALNGAGH